MSTTRNSKCPARSRKIPRPGPFTKVNDGLNATVNFTVETTIELANRVWIGINSPTSLGLYLCAKYGDLESIVTHDIKPSWYLDFEWSRFALDYQATKLLSKSDLPIPSLDPVKRALDSFDSCEKHNESENEMWRQLDVGRFSLLPDVENTLFRARDIIADILGDFNVDEWLDFCKLGPGVVAFGPKDTVDYVKLSADPGVASGFQTYAAAFLSSFGGWWDGLSFSGNTDVRLNPVRGGKYVQVPKNAKTRRNIETQPLLNVFAQLGLGRVIRRRLEVKGVDLSDQTRNQRLAHQGSVNGKLATIDLTNASDMISRGIVAYLLPKRWYFALNAVRTNEILFEGEWRTLNRFSSMGNGFTFELETLIFYALARAVVPTGTVSVYGDDIIVPSHRFDSVCRTLKFCGFQPNPAKSYHTGLFRESCGKDYFNGHLVRPYFLEGIPKNAAEIISLANGLVRASVRLGSNHYFDARLLRAVHYVHGFLSLEIRRGLAYGWPPDDSYLAWHKVRSGFKISYKTPTRSPTSWFNAKTAMLYRIYVRASLRLQREDTTSDGRLTKFVTPQKGGRFSAVDFDVSYWERAFPDSGRPVLELWA